MGRKGSIPDWIPKVVDVTSDAIADVEVPHALQKGASRLGWIWKVVGTIFSCLAAGWAGHATVETWSSRFETVAGAAIWEDRVKEVERWKASTELTVHDLGRDVAQLREDLRKHEASSSDSIVSKPRRKKASSAPPPEDDP